MRCISQHFLALSFPQPLVHPSSPPQFSLSHSLFHSLFPSAYPVPGCQTLVNFEKLRLNMVRPSVELASGAFAGQSRNMVVLPLSLRICRQPLRVPHTPFSALSLILFLSFMNLLSQQFFLFLSHTFFFADTEKLHYEDFDLNEYSLQCQPQKMRVR